MISPERISRQLGEEEDIHLTGVQAQTDCPGPLRRIVVWDADQEREIVLLTNLLDFGATTIAAIYKERWQIELFFRWASRRWLAVVYDLERRVLL